MAFESGSNAIGTGVGTITVTLKQDFGGAPPDTVVAIIENSVDASPKLLKATITDKSVNSFTAEFSGNAGPDTTDSVNYRIDWIAGTSRVFFEVITQSLKKFSALPLFTGELGDTDLFPFVSMAGPVPETKVVKWSKIKEKFLTLVAVPTAPDSVVGGTGPAFAIDDNYLYSKLSSKWGQSLRVRSAQAWDNAIMKEGVVPLNLGINALYEGIEEIIVYFIEDLSPPSFQPPDPSFDLSNPANLPFVVFSFRGENSLELADPSTNPPGDNLDLLIGEIAEVSLNTAPTLVAPSDTLFPVPAPYEGHFRIVLNTPLILDRTLEPLPKGTNKYFLHWKAIQEIT